MNTISVGNQALTFFIELSVYAAVVAWAVSTDFTTITVIILAATGVSIMAVAWGLFAAPRAPRRVRGAGRVAFEVAWFGVGAAAFFASGHRQWGIGLAVVFVVNGALRATYR